MKLEQTVFMLALCVAPLAGCDQGDGAEPPARSATTPPSESAAEDAPASVAEDAPELAELAPVRTRGGALRFVSKQLHEPGAFASLLARFDDSNEAADVRAALVEAMTRTPDYDPGPLVEAFGGEPAAQVRIAMATAFGEGGQQAVDGLSLALADADPLVVSAGLTAWSQRSDAQQLETSVIDKLGAEDGQVVVAAAGALALRGVADAKSELADKLTDDRADVRFAAIKALQRIDADYAASLPIMLGLTGDDDARVARRARGLLDR